jgi:hypothetical protein
MFISQLMLMNYSDSILLQHHSRALLDVVFEWFARIAPKICLDRTILTHRDSWIKKIYRRIDWNLFSCKFYIKSLLLIRKELTH